MMLIMLGLIAGHSLVEEEEFCSHQELDYGCLICSSVTLLIKQNETLRHGLEFV
jgi:hypothetical protein